MDRRKGDTPVASERRAGTDRRQAGESIREQVRGVRELVAAGNELLFRSQTIAQGIAARVRRVLTDQEDDSSPDRAR